MTWLDWLVAALGSWLMFDGLRAISRQKVSTDLGRFEGARAQLIGWLWLALGLLLFWGALTDLAWFEAFIAAFLQAP